MPIKFGPGFRSRTPLAGPGFYGFRFKPKVGHEKIERFSIDFYSSPEQIDCVTVQENGA